VGVEVRVVAGLVVAGDGQRGELRVCVWVVGWGGGGGGLRYGCVCMGGSKGREGGWVIMVSSYMCGVCNAMRKVYW
jgi:hypothetical protein